MPSLLSPVTIITGASSGIGLALARVFAEKGHDLVLVARREPQLAQLADEIEKTGARRPTIVAIDLTRIDGPVRVGHELTARGLEPHVIVNNAGFGLLGSAATLDRGEQLAMIDLNVRALTDLSLRFVDSLARHAGGILNVASTAGFFSGPQMAVYYATKAYVLSFSEALHWELKPLGVRVTALCPGPVATEFQARACIRAGQPPSIFSRSAEHVAREGYEGLVAGRRLVVPGFPNKVATTLPRLLPRSLMLTMVEAWRGGRRPPAADPGWPKRT
jgi:uncharacterized protein